jgi:antitoxin component YwqK of YwqJK toxin-antitoxin module
MKKLFFLIGLAVALSVAGCIKREPVVSCVKMDDIVRSFYPSGKIKTEAHVKDGVLYGPSTMYADGGSKIGEATYTHGVLDGRTYSYYENGKPKGLAAYKQGALDGESINWYENGLKKSSAVFAGGVLQGSVREWDEKGNEIIEPAVVKK